MSKLIENYQRVMFEAVKTNGLDPEDPQVKSAINNGLCTIAVWAQRASAEVRNVVDTLDALADNEDTIEAECVSVLTTALQELSGELDLGEAGPHADLTKELLASVPRERLRAAIRAGVERGWQPEVDAKVAELLRELELTPKQTVFLTGFLSRELVSAQDEILDEGLYTVNRLCTLATDAALVELTRPDVDELASLAKRGVL